MQLPHARHFVATLTASAALAIVLAAPSALAQDKTVNLKLSHWVPPSHPLHKAMEEWGASIDKASNGTIKSTVFPAQQLGKAFDHYDMARDGIAEFVYVNPGYQPGRFPIISAGELPFLVGEAHGGIRAIDAWYRKYAPTEMKDTKYCFSFILDPLRWHSRSKKISVPADIKGMKVRPSHATMAAWCSSPWPRPAIASGPPWWSVGATGCAPSSARWCRPARTASRHAARCSGPAADASGNRSRPKPSGPPRPRSCASSLRAWAASVT